MSDFSDDENAGSLFSKRRVDNIFDEMDTESLPTPQPPARASTGGTSQRTPEEEYLWRHWFVNNTRPVDILRLFARADGGEIRNRNYYKDRRKALRKKYGESPRQIEYNGNTITRGEAVPEEIARKFFKWLDSVGGRRPQGAIGGLLPFVNGVYGQGFQGSAFALPKRTTGSAAVFNLAKPEVLRKRKNAELDNESDGGGQGQGQSNSQQAAIRAVSGRRIDGVGENRQSQPDILLGVSSDDDSDAESQKTSQETSQETTSLSSSTQGKSPRVDSQQTGSHDQQTSHDRQTSTRTQQTSNDRQSQAPQHDREPASAQYSPEDPGKLSKRMKKKQRKEAKLLRRAQKKEKKRKKASRKRSSNETVNHVNAPDPVGQDLQVPQNLQESLQESLQGCPQDSRQGSSKETTSQESQPTKSKSVEANASQSSSATPATDSAEQQSTASQQPSASAESIESSTPQHPSQRADQSNGPEDLVAPVESTENSLSMSSPVQQDIVRSSSAINQSAQEANSLPDEPGTGNSLLDSPVSLSERQTSPRQMQTVGEAGDCSGTDGLVEPVRERVAEEAQAQAPAQESAQEPQTPAQEPQTPAQEPQTPQTPAQNLASQDLAPQDLAPQKDLQSQNPLSIHSLTTPSQHKFRSNQDGTLSTPGQVEQSPQAQASPPSAQTSAGQSVDSVSPLFVANASSRTPENSNGEQRTQSVPVPVQSEGMDGNRSRQLQEYQTQQISRYQGQPSPQVQQPSPQVQASPQFQPRPQAGPLFQSAQVQNPQVQNPQVQVSPQFQSHQVQASPQFQSPQYQNPLFQNPQLYTGQQPQQSYNYYSEPHARHANLSIPVQIVPLHHQNTPSYPNTQPLYRYNQYPQQQQLSQQQQRQQMEFIRRHRAALAHQEAVHGQQVGQGFQLAQGQHFHQPQGQQIPLQGQQIPLQGQQIPLQGQQIHPQGQQGYPYQYPPQASPMHPQPQPHQFYASSHRPWNNSLNHQNPTPTTNQLPRHQHEPSRVSPTSASHAAAPSKTIPVIVLDDEEDEESLFVPRPTGPPAAPPVVESPDVVDLLDSEDENPASDPCLDSTRDPPSNPISQDIVTGENAGSRPRFLMRKPDFPIYSKTAEVPPEQAMARLRSCMEQVSDTDPNVILKRQIYEIQLKAIEKYGQGGNTHPLAREALREALACLRAAGGCL